jgi:hypothetical protein
VLVDLVTDDSQSQSANGTVTAPSSMLKRHEEEVKKDQKLSPSPNSAKSAAAAAASTDFRVATRETIVGCKALLFISYKF